jgi:hypothetical protein
MRNYGSIKTGWRAKPVITNAMLELAEFGLFGLFREGIQ